MSVLYSALTVIIDEIFINMGRCSALMGYEVIPDVHDGWFFKKNLASHMSGLKAKVEATW